jgi:protein arginine N-methyltransferase 1
MLKSFERPLVLALEGLKKVAKLSPKASAYVYDLINRQVFTDLAWHERMLADRIRVEAYRRGIAGAVKPGDVVIDLGTGTGILAFMASRAGAKHVYAIDHSDFIDIAKEISARNGFTNITFVAQNSRDFTPPEQADIVLHEQFGNVAFGENLVMNLLDLKQRCLKPSGRIVPALFDIYVEPVSLKDEYRIPPIWELEDLGIDLGFLEGHEGLKKYMSRFHHLRSVHNFEVEQSLCEPSPVLSVDLNAIRGEQDIAQRHTVSKPVLRSGHLDGYCLYFRCRFDNGTTFDNAPASTQTSWECIVIRKRRRTVAAGAQLSYSVDMAELEKPRTWIVDDARH